MTDRHRALGKWIRLDAGYSWDPRIMRVSLASEVLFVRTLTASRLHGTDGHLTREQQTTVAHGMDPRTARKAWDALVREGLLEACEDGVRVPFDRWRRWQDTEAEMDDARERAREYERQRKAAWRERHRGEF